MKWIWVKNHKAYFVFLDNVCIKDEFDLYYELITE